MRGRADLGGYSRRWITLLSSVSDILALAGFSVLFVVETIARHTMASDAAAPNVSNAIRSEKRVAMLLTGLPLLRPGKGQDYRRSTELLNFTSTIMRP